MRHVLCFHGRDRGAPRLLSAGGRVVGPQRREARGTFDPNRPGWLKSGPEGRLGACIGGIDGGKSTDFLGSCRVAIGHARERQGYELMPAGMC